jgi:hypothetical protein
VPKTERATEIGGGLTHTIEPTCSAKPIRRPPLSTIEHLPSSWQKIEAEKIRVMSN